ncbi:MAG: DUF1259 domain-containing protein [Methylibium sp.]|uniref:DUF1259 domain-containing protein n=1 Tax=Methylibium sp. TaxID=2067992 RepID=UPI0017B1B8B0|nr:DUF1259 domain-containing protein [Methylibium sp.]MBA3596848.1 DUF1259 domain-containing protein [Methylibium sp.]
MLRSTCIAAAFAVLTLAPIHAANAAPALDTKSIESITGLEGSFDKTEQVFKLSKPRDDVKVVVDGWTLPSFMGTGSWAAFKSAGDGVMLMGDTVLFEDEVNAAMSAALKSGLEVTALHNHFFFDEPKVYFMHIAGMGDTEELAKGVRAVYDAVDRVRAKEPKPQAAFGGQIPAKSSITPGPIETLLGEKAQTKDGMAKIVIGRTAEMHGVTMGKAMGVNTWAAFAGSDEQAVVDGDFAMHEDELQPVLKAMRAGGINIVAIHHHMTHEKPRYIFLHYWGKGPALELAKTVRAALDAQAASK